MSSAAWQGALSALTLLAGVWLHSRSGGGRGSLAVVAAAALVALLLFAFHFVADYFTGDGINEAVIYHLRYGLSGAGFAEYFALAALSVALPMAALAALLFFHRRAAATTGARRSRGRVVASLVLMAISLSFHPAGAGVVRMLPVPFPVDEQSASAESAARQRERGQDFERYYVRPDDGADRRLRKNLVVLYAESLERTYLDETLFPGLMPRLRALEKGAVSFTDVIQVPGTGWTIAGMVASQCGLPLFPPAHGNSMSGLDRFLPSAVCLGDVLKDAGYHLAYFGGARTRFAGKGEFYRTHRFDEIMGLEQLRELMDDPAYVSGWGLYDDELFRLAFNRFADLGARQEPFGLFLLTLDTHHPDGHLSASCGNTRYGDGRNPMLNAVHCADRLVAEFVDRIHQSEWGRDTLIVLMSDHLAMRNAAHEILERGRRRNLLMVFDPDTPARQVAERGSLLDVAPTILQFLGGEVRLGLGSSLLRNDDPSVTHRSHVGERLHDWKEAVKSFWDFPIIGEQLEVDATARQVRIDGRTFAIPAFIAIDRSLRTTIKFPYQAPAYRFVTENDPDQSFMLIAECASRDARLPQDTFCLFAGRGNEPGTQLIVRDKASFSPDAIRRMTGIGS